MLKIKTKMPRRAKSSHPKPKPPKQNYQHPERKHNRRFRTQPSPHSPYPPCAPHLYPSGPYHPPFHYHPYPSPIQYQVHPNRPYAAPLLYPHSHMPRPYFPPVHYHSVSKKRKHIAKPSTQMNKTKQKIVQSSSALGGNSFDPSHAKVYMEDSALDLTSHQSGQSSAAQGSSNTLTISSNMPPPQSLPAKTFSYDESLERGPTKNLFYLSRPKTGQYSTAQESNSIYTNSSNLPPLQSVPAFKSSFSGNEVPTKNLRMQYPFNLTQLKSSQSSSSFGSNLKTWSKSPALNNKETYWDESHSGHHMQDSSSNFVTHKVRQYDSTPGSTDDDNYQELIKLARNISGQNAEPPVCDTAERGPSSYSGCQSDQSSAAQESYSFNTISSNIPSLQSVPSKTSLSCGPFQSDSMMKPFNLSTLKAGQYFASQGSNSINKNPSNVPPLQSDPASMLFDHEVPPNKGATEYASNFNQLKERNQTSSSFGSNLKTLSKSSAPESKESRDESHSGHHMQDSSSNYVTPKGDTNTMERGSHHPSSSPPSETENSSVQKIREGPPIVVVSMFSDNED
ncbi:hypothetical protein FOCC_FOCC008240 [Frankliniella occidentalis]|nr:hypothetical protein FOCC_FOCC008240 [Frankliniella occidentalis]